MRIRDLISDLNLATRLEYDMQPLSLRPVSVPGLARAAVSELINAGLSERFEVEVEVAAGAQAVQVLGDERLLLRALHNLLGNSVRHNPAGCRIGVRVGCEGARAWIEVRDGGSGYPIKVLAAMARDDRSDHVMGLGIVRQIARAHGGEAQFENRPEGGCVARVMLPLTGR